MLVLPASESSYLSQMNEWMDEIFRLRRLVESGEIRSRDDLIRVQEDLSDLRERIRGTPGSKRTLLWLDLAILHVSETLVQPDQFAFHELGQTDGR
jgi:hypothetical protein